MVSKRGTTQIADTFPTKRAKGAIRVAYMSARMLGLLLLIVGIGALGRCVHGESNPHDSRLSTNPDWSELIASMDKMHIAMAAVAQSGNSDVNFVRLMIPHHQAAIDMAKTQLLYGKDPQMRRLAQQVVTDQQLEIELMQRWLKEQHTD